VNLPALLPSLELLSMNSRLVLLVAALAACVTSAGCGGPTAPSLKGKVTLDGAPVTSGNIMFLPEDSEDRKAAAAIADGNYTIPAEEGLKPGKYRVEVSWRKPTGRKMPSADPGIAMDETKEVIPAKYNTESTLTAELSAGQAEKDFALRTN
jgi:hypothetical protein